MSENDELRESAPLDDADQGLTDAIDALRDEPEFRSDSVGEPGASPGDWRPVPQMEPEAALLGEASAPADDVPWWREPDEPAAPAEGGECVAQGVPDGAPPGDTSVLPVIAEAVPMVDMGPPTRRGRWWVWLIVALIVAIIAGAAGYAWWWSTSREIIAPDVVGKRAAEATQVVNDTGLRLGEVSEIPTDAAPVGTIISQKPEAGTSLKPDAELSFVLAASPEQSKVPSVEGMSAEAAAATLAEARLRVYEVASYDAGVAAGFVVAQLPDAGQELQPGEAVAVVVSKGPAPTSVTVPRLTGMQEGDAVTLLKAVGLTARVYRTPDASLTVGEVANQSPLAGTATAPNSSVQVLVSQGAVTGALTVPDVVGKTRKEAVAALKARGLEAKGVRVVSDSVAKGRVISQMPQAGGLAAPNGTVGLLVSKGNSRTGPVPSVVGTMSTEATTAITDAGFRPVMVTVALGGKSAGAVFAQFPAPGTEYTLRYPVVCLVAKAPGQ